MVGVIARDEDV